MPRLFTAIDPPSAAVERLRAFCDGQDPPFDARWTPPANYHVTLRFIGNVDAARAETLEAALADVEAPRFTAEPAGLSVLPSRRRPRVLMLALDPTEPLRALHRAVDGALATAGVERESRAYRPHVTLARLRKADPKAVHRFLRNAPALDPGPFPVERFVLYESSLQPDNAVHTARRKYALTNPA